MKKYLVVLALVIFGSSAMVSCTDEFAEDEQIEELAGDKDEEPDRDE